MAEDKKDFVVVQELPQVSTRQVSDGDKEYDLVTVPEALKEILETVREIKKGVTG